MIDFIVEGGPLFTIPLAVLALAVLVVLVLGVLSARDERGHTAFWSRMLFHIGLFAFMFGILSQAIGLYQMMSAIEAVGNVSPALVMGGLKVSMIAPLFGLVIFLIALIAHLGLEWSARRGVLPSQTSKS